MKNKPLVCLAKTNMIKFTLYGIHYYACQAATRNRICGGIPRRVIQMINGKRTAADGHELRINDERRTVKPMKDYTNRRLFIAHRAIQGVRIKTPMCNEA